jgi:phosphohistidine phosphatase SixA
MRTTSRTASRRTALWIGASLLLNLRAAAAADTGWSRLRDGDIVLLRHANAPGVGDPPGFVLRDCRTQRNLDGAGRTQARQLGERFRTHRVTVGAVLSSQWCRTRDTAELAFPGRVREDADFNSFFAEAARATEQTRRAIATLSRWRGPGVLVVVTHQVNISALTGIAPASGEGIVIRARPDGAGLEFVSRLAP